ncbi:MAG: hypothetical protein HQ477_02575 [Chloroflexi bacterium]|nr:hypothetical protein [Chloroflexota bacterium]
MTNVYLIAVETDPVANVVDSIFIDVPDYRRVTIREFDDMVFGVGDVLLLGSVSPLSDSAETPNLPLHGLTQYLGCRPPSAVLDHASESNAIVAGISPLIAARVANRVIGFTGPLTVKPMPQWGVIGLGEVGCEVVRKVTAIRASAVVTDIRTPRTGILDELGVRRQTLDLLMSRADVISIHVHAGPTAAPLISQRELGLMKPEAVVINTSDESVVDERAVLAALERGDIAGYATDCPGGAITNAGDSLELSGKLIITTNPLTNQIGAAQQIAKYVQGNIEAFISGSNVQGRFEPLHFPTIGDPSFWSSRMSPRQD